ncbi:MAG: DNA-processing protein DprA [Eubacterium sp.]|nr:DNA-processing protein DprA [Eubacterium sp.]
MMDIDDMVSLWISQISGIGPVGRKILKSVFGSEKNMFLAGEDEIKRRLLIYNHTGMIDHSIQKKRYIIPENIIKDLTDTEKKLKIRDEASRLMKKGISLYRTEDEGYPDRLRHIKNPPDQLFVIGSLPDPDTAAIAIIGARNCTPYGRDMARMFGYRLAEAGVNVISGMAIGIDGWSHRGAIEAGGRTYAVLGSGVEVCYPPANEKLYNTIPERGGIISEYPTGYGAMPVNFPMRNRIISGLSDGILVVEARMRSGSLITVDFALDQGKDVFVIPGRIGDELSVGCNRLIRQGAIPVLTPDDILEYYNIEIKAEKTNELDADENRIYSMIGEKPVGIMKIAQNAQGSLANTISIISGLKKRGFIREVAKDQYIRC